MKANGRSTTDVAAQTEALLAELWERNLHIVKERLLTLDRAAAMASAGSLTEDAREEALNISHKLAGSLGMFGYHRGTEIARELELLFRTLPPASPDRITPLTMELRKTTQISSS